MKNQAEGRLPSFIDSDREYQTVKKIREVELAVNPEIDALEQEINEVTDFKWTQGEGIKVIRRQWEKEIIPKVNECKSIFELLNLINHYPFYVDRYGNVRNTFDVSTDILDRKFRNVPEEIRDISRRLMEITDERSDD